MRLKHRLACMAAAALCTISTSVTAGIVQVGVRTFAGDFPAGLPYVVSTDGSLACCLTTASRTVTATAGSATATSMAEANSLNGTLKERISANVAVTEFVIGRNSGGSSSAAMQGDITLSGPLPGMATFAGVLEGVYNIGTRPFPSLDQSVRIQYAVSIGNRFDNSPARPPFQDDMYFFDFGPRTFNIPFSWTQMVNPGDVMHFDFYLRTEVSAVAGSVDFDATNTFKITDISLPPGYTFTSDATGFLSQFGAPPVVINPGTQVPEPGTLLLIGLAGVLAVVARRPGLRHRSRGTGVAGERMSAAGEG